MIFRKRRVRRTKREVLLSSLTSFNVAEKTEIYEELKKQSIIEIRIQEGSFYRVIRHRSAIWFLRMYAEWLYLVRWYSKFILRVSFAGDVVLEFWFVSAENEYKLFSKRLCVLVQ